VFDDMNVKAVLSGKKTYFVAFLMFVYAVLGAVIGQLDQLEVIKLILESLGLASLRAGIFKIKASD